MTLDLKIPSATESKIREHAAAAGQDLETFVLRAVAEKLASIAEIFPARNGTDWKSKLHACIDLHPVATDFVDDSRESIYAGRGE
jgi:hypothetical protein